jgi:hypothetical protein
MDYWLELSLKLLLKLRWENSARLLVYERNELHRHRDDCIAFASKNNGQIRTPRPMFHALLDLPIPPKDVGDIVYGAEQAARDQSEEVLGSFPVPNPFLPDAFEIVWFAYYDAALSIIQDKLEPKWFLPRNYARQVNRARREYDGMKLVIRKNIRYAIREARANGQSSDTSLLRCLLIAKISDIVGKNSEFVSAIERSVEEVREDIVEIARRERESRCRLPGRLFELLIVYKCRDYLLSHIEDILAEKVA